MKLYRLERLVSNDTKTKLKTWQKITESDDLSALKKVCPKGHRIINNETGKVVWEP